jgi:acetyl-CoA carboxylase biotin carboxylase subunit
VTAFSSLLVANRGEIARRVFRSARSMGLRTVAVYVDVDADAPFVREADEAVRLASGYLDVAAIVAAARAAGAEAVHPGYGFLSENAGFAQAVIDAGLVWVGPPPAVVEVMGDKLAAKHAAVDAGVPILPSSDDPADAGGVGYPLLVKAAAGGGGKGMRVVRSPGELAEAVAAAGREAASSFGDDRVFLERYVERARHVEIQILGDAHGRLVHLGERECSIQRRHQKLIEESPSVALTDKMRRKMGGVVVDAARAVQYTNAGTFEFLMDGGGRFYFMEVNTRLQVEHPVTEMVTGVDIVKEQIRIAAGERLSFKQSEITFTGHAIECRVNAEDPDTFRPSPGIIHAFSVPGGPGVRIDTCAHTECTISPYYDSLIAKVIVHGRDRQEAIARMRRALEMTVIEGISTSIPLHLRLLAEPDFQAGRLSTSFMDRYLTAGANGETLKAAG